MAENKLLKENIVYIDENDAKTIGIVEGEQQSVFIDGKNVDVVFVDEHDILPTTKKEKDIIQEASELAINRKEDEHLEERALAVRSGKTYNFWENIKEFFAGAASNIINYFKNLFNGTKKFDGTDVFTDEEIRIIEEVISEVKANKDEPTSDGVDLAVNTY